MPAPDFYSMIAVERGKPEGWRWFSIKALGDFDGPRASLVTLVEGGVPVATFKSGPRKGMINWSKCTDAGQLIVTQPDYDARVLRWESETGKCRDCGGDAEEVASVSVHTGRTMRPCRRCKGTGNAVPK